MAISGKNHQIFLFPIIVIEGLNAEPTRIEETKGCNLFCIGTVIASTQPPSPPRSGSSLEVAPNIDSRKSSASINSAKSTHLLCVAVKKVILIYEINASAKPKYKKLREIELAMMTQSMQIINNQLCVGFQSEFALYSLVQETAPIALLQPDKDRSLQFLIKDPINALSAVQITNDEYLLVFESKFMSDCVC